MRLSQWFRFRSKPTQNRPETKTKPTGNENKTQTNERRNYHDHYQPDTARNQLPARGQFRPRVKEMDVRYNVSGIREPDFTGVYFEAYVSETEVNAIENELETL